MHLRITTASGAVYYVDVLNGLLTRRGLVPVVNGHDEPVDTSGIQRISAAYLSVGKSARFVLADGPLAVITTTRVVAVEEVL